VDIYEINLVIEKKQFTKAFCTEIIYSLFEAHKEEFKDNKLEQGGRWSQSQVRNSKYLEKEIETLYYSQNMWGVDLPYPKSVTSINVVYDRKDYPIDNWYENIPKDKAVIAIRTDRPNVYWVDDPNDKWAPQIAKNINNFVKDSITVYNAIHPITGSNCWDNDRSTVTTIPTNAEHITWLTFFGPELVNKFGRKKILSAPAYKIVEFSDGGILLMSGPTPFGNKKNEHFEEWNTIVCQDKIAKHLGLGEYLPKTR